MDEYQHPLFFEAKELTDREKEKIRRHFQKRRDSGGGECGMIEKVGSNTYKICFKEKEDQERVLQRKFHTISLPCGELCLTVSRTDSPQNPDQSTSQSQTFTKANTKELEKIFPMDIFLMYYLRDNAKAAKVLQKQLSAISCTMELNLEAEEAVVRGDIEKGSFVSAAENWEIQVDRVFNSFTESYFCYHVVEPKKVKILLQDLSFVTDDIRVYTEGGYAVVVGEDKAVRERMATLEKSLPTRKELPITEKHFRLVEEEFSQEMYAHCPEVQVRRGNATIILDGPDKDVQSGAAKLDELIKKIKEKRVKLCTALLTFITSSGAISKYQARFQQSLRSPVSLEVGSDLVLSSLSSDALDEAEAALQRDLSLANVQLQGAAAAPQDLDTVEKIMIKAQNEANCHELRVDFRLMPGPSGTASTMVQLVGYSENVNKLKEVLHDYQMNQVRTQEILNLPHPELVDCFDKVLNMIGVKQTKVTLKASHVPYPCVLMSGPRRLVQEVQADLNATVAGLISDTLVLDGPGAQLYFQAEGKVSKELVESSCQVLIREQQSVHSRSQSISIPSVSRLSISRLSIGSPCFSGPGASSATPRCFITSRHCNTVGSIAINRTSLEIKLGSLEDEQVNVLVVPMLNRQLNSTKIGKGLLNKAGNAIKTKFDTMAVNRTLVPGDILQVDAPRSLGCLKLFFIECSPWDGVRGWSVQALGIGLKRCLDLCVQQGFCSVAFPVIGPGFVLKFPLTEAIQVLTENIRHFGLSASCGSLSTIHIVIKPGYPYSEECYHDVYKHLSSTMNQGGHASVPPLPLVQQQQPPSSVSADLSMLHTPSTNQQSVFLFLGLSRQDVDDAKRKLKDLYQAQCSTQTFTKGELAGLTQDDMKTLKQLVETQGLYLQRDQSGQGSLTVSGLKDGVNQVMQMINACLHGSLRREVRVREEEDLYARVAWCIMGLNGNWERLPKTANHNLENKDTAGGIVDAQSIQWSVDLQQSVAVRSGTGQTAKLKRLVNLPDFSLPLYWDNMAADQNLEVFELQPSSAEYHTVMEAFKRTVTKTVIKIERLQNVHLRRAYEVQKKHISDKNRHEGGAGEKFLYHGTTQDNCDSIMKTGFNRRFAGQNATSYGRGTYFAVHASYSAYPTYSKPATDGSQLMFVARVLTGIYTQGRSDMKVPPPRSASQPHDRYDSVVDALNNPRMYVVFHDDQAYPDYLITFK